MRFPWKSLFGQRTAEQKPAEPPAESTFGELFSELKAIGVLPERSADEPVTVRKLRQRFGGKLLDVVSFRGEWSAIVRPAGIVEICRFLRDDPELAMVFLTDVCAIHWMDRDYEHEVVYLLYSFKLNQRLRLKCRLAPGESIASVTGLFPGADWHEREAFDLVGVVFEGHPDLRRILMPEDYDEHPLRRDFPVKGY